MNVNRKKIFSILMGLIIIILLIGFVFMSLILIDILKSVNSYSKDFINFIKDLRLLEVKYF